VCLQGERVEAPVRLQATSVLRWGVGGRLHHASDKHDEPVGNLG
jgi:hypothetical protein